jgi:nitroreductase
VEPQSRNRKEKNKLLYFLSKKCISFCYHFKSGKELIVKLKELILANRSYRRFEQNFRISRQTLLELVDLARLSPSAGNKQPLRYILSCQPEKNSQIFSFLQWAAYLKDWSGPAEGERPSAYIIILGDSRISPTILCDHGIAAQSILLGAAEKGLGGCIIASIKKEELRKEFDILEYLEILLVIALGKPLEEIRLEKVKDDGDIKYWRDEQGVHHVPKRSLEEIILR